MVTGILAHVDAGKTTLSESILYHAGIIKEMGRVDHKNTFLDTADMEKQRGITIYSKEASLKVGDKEIYLIDTPGHVDFSPEMERSLSVLDYAILVISGTDGVQAHTGTLWRLFALYNIPVFVFVNKMDQPDISRELVMKDIEKLCGSGAVDFTDLSDDVTKEAIAMCDEEMLDKYMESGQVAKSDIVEAIANRQIFPCFFGSALKDIGVTEFMEAFAAYTRERVYRDEFSARVYKIARDEQGARLTYLKVTGGSLRVKSAIEYRDINESEKQIINEKIDQIRIYSGDKYIAVSEVQAGAVCTVTGFTKTYAGQVLGDGSDEADGKPVLEPVLRYRLVLPKGCDVFVMLKNMKQLEEEEPQLKVEWNEQHYEIYVKVMGAVYLEVLKSVIYDRFDVEVTFDNGNVVYKETIEDRVYGVGHYEPLKHYAEVHLILEPGECGSGIVVENEAIEDELDKNWQRLIITHILEKKHLGVLTGSEITDVKITLVAGRAHKKHTEGGDFRQATYRAIRQGLKQAKSKVLEPYYKFKMEMPNDCLGRAMTDIQKMNGRFMDPVMDGESVTLEGYAPVSLMSEYSQEFTAYTRGRGRFFCEISGYEECHNSDEVIENIGYDSESDVANPTGSMFCAHGAGFYVPWDEVHEMMHLESRFHGKKESYETMTVKKANVTAATDEELKAIFEKTYRNSDFDIINNPYRRKSVSSVKASDYKYKGKKEPDEECLLVDGYNIIFAWEDLKELANVNLDGARGTLQDILSNYQGYKKCHLIVVFDAYKVKGNRGSIEKYNDIYVVYTKEAETADAYIEKTVKEMGKKYRVTVATSDRLEQMIVVGEGAHRLSARDFYAEVERVNEAIRGHL